jgi:hypothetical protein
VTTNRTIENRQTRRYTIRLSAELKHGGRTFTATTHDLSLGGVRLESHRVLPEGDALSVALFLVVDDVEDAAAPALELRGKVMWAAPGEEGRPGTMGIRFENLSDVQNDGLSRFLKMLPEG